MTRATVRPLSDASPECAQDRQNRVPAHAPTADVTTTGAELALLREIRDRLDTLPDRLAATLAERRGALQVHLDCAFDRLRESKLAQIYDILAPGREPLLDTVQRLQRTS